MIQDLIESARLEAGQVELKRQPVDLRSFVTDLLDRITRGMDTGRVKVNLPLDLPPVNADPNRLERILTNLLSNAPKYSLDGTEVVVQARVVSGMVVTSVADHGTGISAEELPRVFERFFRARDAHHHEGLGPRAVHHTNAGRVSWRKNLG